MRGEPTDFFSFSREGLERHLAQHFGLPPFRAHQLYCWVYKRGSLQFNEMTDLSKELREVFSAHFSFPSAVQRERRISEDGSRKYLFEVEGGDLIESVMIKQPKRMTLCLSSQVGCAMACSFCKTGTMGLKRNLSTSEIVRQVTSTMEDARAFGDTFQNIVFMGMGEPLHNFNSLVEAIKILKDDRGLGISGRRMTISSVGLVPAITKFGQTGLGVNLAISLNATTDEVRSQLMPITKAYPIQALLECLRLYPLRRRDRFTIEYVMLAGVNDTEGDLARLPLLLRGIPCKINLIPYNENTGLGFRAPPKVWIRHWQDYLLRRGVETTIRWSKGADIGAACGQLATESKKTNLKSRPVTGQLRNAACH